MESRFHGGNGDGVPGIPMVEPPFPGLSVNFNLNMDPPIGESGVVVSIDVIGGLVQLCLEPSGCEVTFIADTTLVGNSELESLEWTVDGVYSGSGEEISPVLTLGSHTIKVLATTTTGETNSDEVTVTLIDRILPTPLPDGTRLTIGPESYFASGSTVPLNEGADGLVFGEVVPALPNSYHPGALDGNPDEQGGIVQSYEFLGNTGTFWTASPIVDLGGGLIDMSGWDAAWDIWPSMGFDNPIGSFTVVGDSYILEHTATVTGGPFPGAISYTLHLEGKVQLPNEAPDCLQAVPSLDTIWPPNHKLVPVTVEGVTDPDSDSIVITVNSIYQDEPVNTYGDGNFVPDGQGIGTDTAEVRAERSGTRKVPGDGRFYHIEFSADDGQGGSCSGEVTIAVPHAKNAVPVDDGPLYDSTGP